MPSEEDKPQMNKKLEERLAHLSKSEQTAMLQQLNGADKSIVPTTEHRFGGRRARIGIISDTHIGSSYFNESLTNGVFDYFKKKKVDAIYHAGDILEGMSGRPGHIYELDQAGLTAQVEKAAEVFGSTDIPIYAITGNHDQWYMKKADIGADVGKILDEKLKNFNYLGMDEANVILDNGINLKLIHPGKGTSYALSYQGQKLIESYESDERPDIQASGHYHKGLFMKVNGVNHFEAGTLCGQTGWMRSKNIPAHEGAWMVDVHHNKKGLSHLTSEFLSNNKGSKK